MVIIAALVPDLMFETRIRDAAGHLHYSMEMLDPNDDSAAAIARVAPVLLVVSLDAPHWQDFVRAAKNSGARVLAFGSHKNVEAIQTARAMGCDEVVARSRMAAELPNLLKKYVQEH